MRRYFARRYRGVRIHDCTEYGGQYLVLRVVVRRRVLALEFDADGEIIAALVLPVSRLARMPGTLREWHELDQFTVPADQQVRGDFETASSYYNEALAKAESASP